MTVVYDLFNNSNSIILRYATLEDIPNTEPTYRTLSSLFSNPK